MICDSHVHILGAGPPNGDKRNYISPSLYRRVFPRYLKHLGLEDSNTNIPSGGLDEAIAAQTAAIVSNSPLHGAVLLAFDAAYDETGQRLSQSSLVVDNDFVADVVRKHDSLFFGASIHPYRRDAIRELERMITLGGCLIKWLPSAQNICLSDSRCFPFYEALAHYNTPLLVHLGNEHMLSGKSNSLNRPIMLQQPLKYGVTIIGAHCGARLFLHDRCFFSEWVELTQRHQNLYGDLSFFLTPTRLRLLSRISNSTEIQSKIIYGSDFPCVSPALSCLFQLGWKRCQELRRIANPIAQHFQSCRTYGNLPEEIFHRAAKLLRLSPNQLPQEIP